MIIDWGPTVLGWVLTWHNRSISIGPRFVCRTSACTSVRLFPGDDTLREHYNRASAVPRAGGPSAYCWRVKTIVSYYFFIMIPNVIIIFMWAWFMRWLLHQWWRMDKEWTLASLDYFFCHGGVCLTRTVLNFYVNQRSYCLFCVGLDKLYQGWVFFLLKISDGCEHVEIQPTIS